MKIFLTGGSGFLGKNIYEFFSKYEFFLFKRGQDITKELEKFKPDIIIHSAGEIYKEDLMLESNIVLTYSILEYCKNNKINKLIYFGSSSEYGKTKLPMKESDPCNAYSIYAATKSSSTLLCQAFSRTYNFNCYIIRPFSIYGKYEPKHRLIPTLFKKAFNQEEITLIEGNHDFFYIKDFLKIIDAVIKNNEKTNGEIINAGYGIQFSNQDILKKIETITGKKINFKTENIFKREDSETWICDITNAKSIYKYKCFPEYDLQKGLTEYYTNGEWK